MTDTYAEPVEANISTSSMAAALELDATNERVESHLHPELLRPGGPPGPDRS